MQCFWHLKMAMCMDRSSSKLENSRKLIAETEEIGQIFLFVIVFCQEVKRKSTQVLLMAFYRYFCIGQLVTTKRESTFCSWKGEFPDFFLVLEKLRWEIYKLWADGMKQKVRETREMTGDARRILQRMLRRVIANNIVLWTVIAVLFTSICLVIYHDFIKRSAFFWKQE